LPFRVLAHTTLDKLLAVFFLWNICCVIKDQEYDYYGKLMNLALIVYSFGRLAGDFPIFNMAAVCHIGFFKSKFWLPMWFRGALPCQISWRSTKHLLLNRDFSIFKITAVLHLGFLKTRNFNCQCGSDGQYASPCQISKFRGYRLNRCWDMAIYLFLNGSCPPSCICFERNWITHEEYLLFCITMQMWLESI